VDIDALGVDLGLGELEELQPVNSALNTPTVNHSAVVGFILDP
jgi:hypothetical protein